MKVNSGQAASTLIPEYIGSAFDKVIKLADNLEHIKEVAAIIEGIPTYGYIGDTPPTQPSPGAEWYCTVDGRSYIWYEDGDSGQWVESSPQSTANDPSVVGDIFTLWKRSAAEAGYNLVAGSFEEGGVLTSPADVLWHKGLDSIYSWTGAYPAGGYVVSPGTDPTAVTGYVPRTDVVLRDGLLSGALRVRDELFALRDVVSVKDFGAVGNGVTDDTAAIQEALTFVGASGGRVYFPRGSYLIAGGGTTYVFEMIGYNNLSICGDGVGNTVIKVADNGDRGIFSYTNCNSIELANLTLDANASNGVTGLGGHGVRLDDCDDVYFHNIVVRDTQGYGIGFQGYGDFKRVILDTVEIIDSGADGVDFKNRANSNDALTINNVVIRRPSRIEDGKPGLDIRGPATINNVAVFLGSDDGIGIRFRASATEPGQNGVGGEYSSLSNFYVDGGGYAITTGVVIDAPNVSVSNGSAVNVGGVGVWLTLNSQNSHVSNVHVDGVVNCINFEVAGTRNTIIGCSSDVGATGYRINGADNRLVGCTHEGGTYGFRRTSGTAKNYLIGCKSANAAVTNLDTGAIDSILSSDFGNSDTTPHDLCVNGNTALRLSPVSGGVNYVQLAAGGTGAGPSITVGGKESSRPLLVGARSSHVSFLTAGATLGANEQLRVLHATGAVNYATVKGSTANIPVNLSVEGSDAAIDLLLSPKGTGNVRFGVLTASSDVPVTGYIEIKDAGGTVRRLAVIG